MKLRGGICTLVTLALWGTSGGLPKMTVLVQGALSLSTQGPRVSWWVLIGSDPRATGEKGLQAPQGPEREAAEKGRDTLQAYLLHPWSLQVP